MLGSGTCLANRYEILEKIGSGGMADVYKAKDTVLNRLVAIKVLKQEYSTDATFVKKFKVEAQSAGALSHPNIVGVYDVGEDNGIHFIVMELVQGITLKNYIDMKGKLDIREALNISVQIAMGLSAAHANRVIHRDIKPQNIIMSRDGKVKVTDFGIAKMADSTTVTTTAAGTVHYISPEQARGGYSDEKSDIYSLGITMYEMVTGRVPFEGETNVAVALLHIQGEMIPPKQLEPSIPESFNKIILKCTQKRPERRYASAKELITDLRKVLTHPDGEYVVLPGIVPVGRTIVMEDDDVSRIKEAASAGRTKKITPVTAEEEAKAAAARKKAEEQVAAEEEEEDEEESSGLSKIMMILGIGGGIILIVVIVFLVLNVMGGFFGSSEKESETVASESVTETDAEQVEVPDLLGMTEAEARSAVRDAGLKINVMDGSSDKYDEGQVYDQSPAAYEQVEAGETITVYINTEAQTTELQDISGMDYTQAQAKLESLGYKVELEFEYSDEVSKDKVIRTEPEAGSQVEDGAKIVIYASQGQETKEVTMPDLHGMTLDEAISTIESYGLIYGGKYSDYSDNYDEGDVMLQSVNAGATVETGTSVTVTVSLGAKVSQYTATVSIPSPFGVDIVDNEGGEAHIYTEGQVKVVVSQNDGTSQTVYDQYCTQSTIPSSVTVTSSSSSSGTASIYINGSLFDTVSVTFN